LSVKSMFMGALPLLRPCCHRKRDDAISLGSKTLVIPGHREAMNSEPLNTDRAHLAKVRVHGFPLARE
jgi:hypothetical protein